MDECRDCERKVVEGETRLYLPVKDVARIINETLHEKLADGAGMYLGDERYYCPPVAELQRILADSKLDADSWEPDRHDCDDFAYRLKGEFCRKALTTEIVAGYCVGIAWGLLPGPHAINWVILRHPLVGGLPPTPKSYSEPTLYFIEPQTDEIYEPRASDTSIWLILA